VYQESENNIALGSTEIEITPNVPDNFHQDDVTFEIPKFIDSNSDEHVILDIIMVVLYIVQFIYMEIIIKDI
jgi:hypothetical protein